MKRLLLIIATLLCLVVPASAFAYNPLSNACGSGGGVTGSKGASACSASTKDPISGPNGMLKKVSLVLSFIAGVAAVIIILFGAFNFITADGDAQKAAGARKAIIGAVVGLVIIVMAEAIIVFVVSKL